MCKHKDKFYVFSVNEMTSDLFVIAQTAYGILNTEYWITQ